LGLSVVHGAVTSAGGTIDVHGRPGDGTRFDLWLPAVEGSPEAPARSTPAAPSAPARASRAILLVKDDPTVRALAVRMLVRGGYTVVEAASAREARERFTATAQVTAVVSDVVMPGKDGLTLGKELRAAGYTGPLIFVSGFLDERKAGDLQAGGGAVPAREALHRGDVARGRARRDRAHARPERSDEVTAIPK
jgi:two-component system cell cycle sensor histidine kinase/response regulator CckA